LAGTSLLKLQNDERLVSLARDGHEQAFAAIVERYGGQLERYASRLVGPTRAEDALQQAFVNAHSALIKDPEKTIELRPWLYRIVHNAALNTLRASRDEQPLGDDTELLGLTDDAIERRELLREALEAVAALPAQQRDAIILRELEGRSHDEIAVALGVTPGAARQQIFRARAALRAAATAVTPAPLLVRLMDMAAASGSGAGDVATAAGGGLTAILAKASAGVLVTGAVAGGAVGTGVVAVPGTSHKTPLVAQATAETHSSSQSAARPSAGGTVSASAAEHRSGNEDRSGSSSAHGKKTRRHRGGRSGEHASSNSSGRRGDSTSTVVSGRNDSSSTGSGSSGSDDSGHRQSRGTDDGSGHGSGSGSGRRGSGTSGRHGSGSGSGKSGSHHSGSGSGKSGSHHSGSGSGKGGSHHSGSGGSQAAEVEAQHVETEAPGDVSGKPATAGGSGGGGGGNATTTPTVPVDPAATGGGGGGGGKVSESTLAVGSSSGSGGK
jgi:RNA polymerase sigma factor (sigma-70 family)